MKSFIDRVWDSTLQVTWKTTTYRQKCSKTGLFSPRCWAWNPGVLHAREEVCHWASPQLLKLDHDYGCTPELIYQKSIELYIFYDIQTIPQKTLFLKEKTTASWNLVWFWKTSTYLKTLLPAFSKYILYESWFSSCISTKTTNCNRLNTKQIWESAVFNYDRY